MTPRARRMLAAHRRQMPRARVMLKQGDATCDARAKAEKASLDEITSGIAENTYRLVILAEEVTFGAPLAADDTVVVDGADLLITSVDDQKRRVDGFLIAYEVVAAGA